MRRNAPKFAQFSHEKHYFSILYFDFLVRCDFDINIIFINYELTENDTIQIINTNEACSMLILMV